MPDPNRPILVATRGSALALAQANLILAQCRAAFPEAPVRDENHQNHRRQIADRFNGQD